MIRHFHKLRLFKSINKSIYFFQDLHKDVQAYEQKDKNTLAVHSSSKCVALELAFCYGRMFSTSK